VIEELLAENGFEPDIDDDALGAAYDRCPAVQKSVVKNAVAFAWALAQEEGSEPVSETRRFAHVDRTVSRERLDWAFFAVDLRVFPPTAVCSAMVQALAARVDDIVVHVSGPVTDPLLFGFDLLSAHLLFTREHGPILDLLAGEGEGVVVDLAGMGSGYRRAVRPDPAAYGVAVDLPDSEFVRAYRDVTAETAGQPRPFISYGGQGAPVVMAERFLGCWPWDIITPQTFRRSSTMFF
jgi:hypothetical protein